MVGEGDEGLNGTVAISVRDRAGSGDPPQG